MYWHQKEEKSDSKDPIGTDFTYFSINYQNNWLCLISSIYILGWVTYIENKTKILIKYLFSICRESNVLKRVAQCCLLNGGVFGFSIILFEYGLLPFIRFFLSWMFGHNPGVGATVGNWIVSFLSIIFGMTWILPLFILSKIVNSLWFQVG